MFDNILRFNRYMLSEYAISKGAGFRLFDEVTIAPGESFMWSFVTPPNQAVVLFDRVLSCTQPNVRYESFVAATGVTYGATLPVRNMNSLSAKTSGALVRKLTAGTPSGVAGDIDITRGQLAGAGNQSRATGDTFHMQDIRIFPPGFEVFSRALNNSGETADLLVYLKFFVAPASVFQD